MISTGDRIPSFSLLDQNGDTVTAADWKGKKVILFAFPRADTPG
jgi:peroxiredoxin Q/BCP